MLKDARQVNPLEIGSSEVDARPTRWWRRFFSKPSLSVAERNDLVDIDIGGLTLERIKQYAYDHAYYFEEGGRARYEGAVKLEYQEATSVRDWFEAGAYSRVAAYFLQRAKEQWLVLDMHQSEREEWRVQLASGETMAAVPSEIIAQGDDAINEYVRVHPTTRKLVIANDTTQMYLKQAAVLARIIDQQQSDER